MSTRYTMSRMEGITKYLLFILILLLLKISACYPSHQKIKKDWATKTAVNLIEGEQYSDCSGIGRFCDYNCMKECVYEEYHCLGNGRGNYCVYARCDSNLKKDTIVYIEFKTNQSYKQPSKKQRNWDLPIQNYRYIADGFCLFAEGHHLRVNKQRIDIGVYLAADSIFDSMQGVDELYERTKWGYMEYWKYGKMYGAYKNGKREGKWTFIDYNTSQDTTTCTVIIDNKKQECNYENGYRNGWCYIINTLNNKYDSILYEKGIVKNK